MHTLVRLGLAGGAVAAGTGAAIALVLGQQPRPVTPTPSAPATVSVATDAYSPSNPTPTCPDGSSVFVYGRTDAAAGARYQAVGFRNCGRPETLRLDQLPDMAVTNRDGTLGAPVVTRQLRASVDVKPGETAWFLFKYRGGGSSEEPGQRAATVTFTLPGLGAGVLEGTTDLGPDSPVTLRGWSLDPSDAVNG